MTDFKIIPIDTWLPSHKCERTKSRYWPSVFFEDIVDLLASESIVLSHKKQKHPRYHSYHRINLTIGVTANIVDLFHNSNAGYRAQYYHSTGNGESANFYLIQEICPVILRSLWNRHKSTCPPSFIEASLFGVNAKVWIHQGRWLRTKPLRDRKLFPKRWKDISNRKPNKKQTELLIWGSLIARGETRIDIKGDYIKTGYLHLNRVTKPNRAEDIHYYGFT